MRSGRGPKTAVAAPGSDIGVPTRGGRTANPGGGGRQPAPSLTQPRNPNNPNDVNDGNQTEVGADGKPIEDRNPFLDDLDKLAPLPDSPKSYKPGDTFYRAFVTFEVEIIDLNAPPPAASDQEASVSQQDEESIT